METCFIILLIALVLDWYIGEPDFLWSRLPHPVALFGKAVSFVDRNFNTEEKNAETRYKAGALSIAALIILSAAFGIVLEILFSQIQPLGYLLEVLIVFSLLAQKSLFDHVRAVATGLRENGLDGGRDAVAMIVGRDPDLLDRDGVCRAAIESLAENFSDGVLAPAFWYLIFGLPGIIVYKMINTADSMIGYKSEKYLDFGRSAAQIDDLANWLPARISAFVISIAVFLLKGLGAMQNSLATAFRDSGLHRSPNAGWPEAAMAGAAEIALGGPRIYSHETVEQAWINSNGKRVLDIADIENCLRIFSLACQVLWGVVFLFVIVGVLF